MLTPGSPNAPRSEGPANLPSWAVEPRELEQITERAALPVITATQRTSPPWRWAAKQLSAAGSKIREVLIRWGIISPPKFVENLEIPIPQSRIKSYQSSFLKRLSPLFGGDIEGRLRYEWEKLEVNDPEAVTPFAEKVTARLEALRGLVSPDRSVTNARDKRVAQLEKLHDEVIVLGGNQEERFKNELVAAMRNGTLLDESFMNRLDARETLLQTIRLGSEEIQEAVSGRLQMIKLLKNQAKGYELERQVRVEGDILAVVPFVDFAREHGLEDRAAALIKDLESNKIPSVISRMRASLEAMNEEGSKAGVTTLQQVATLHAITKRHSQELQTVVEKYLTRLNEELKGLGEKANLADFTPILAGIKRAYEHAEQITDYPLSEADFQFIHKAIHDGVNKHLMTKVAEWKEEKQQPLLSKKETIDKVVALYARGVEGTLPTQVGVALATIETKIKEVTERLAPLRLELEQFERLTALSKELEGDHSEIERARAHSQEAEKRVHDAAFRLAELNEELDLLTIEHYFITKISAGDRDTVPDEAALELTRYQENLSEELKRAIASEITLKESVAAGNADGDDLVALQEANQRRPDMQAWLKKEKFIQEIQGLAKKSGLFQGRQLKARLAKIEKLRLENQKAVGLAKAEYEQLKAANEEAANGIQEVRLRKQTRLKEIEKEMDQLGALVGKHASLKMDLDFKLHELERHNALIRQVKEEFEGASSRSTTTMAWIQLLDQFIRDFNLEDDVKTQAKQRLSPQSESYPTYLEGVAQYFKSLGLDPEQGRKLAGDAIGVLRDQLTVENITE